MDLTYLSLPKKYQRVIKFFNFLFLLFISTCIVSVFIWIWGDWQHSWKLFVSSIIGAYLMRAGVSTTVNLWENMRDYKRMEENKAKPKQKSKFQERLEEAIKESNEQKRK